MKQLSRTITLAAALVAALAAPVLAQEIKAGDLVIASAWSRATPSGAKVAGAYLTVENKGTSADRLVSGSADIAGRVEIHEMTMDGGVMKMRAVARLDLPAGKPVILGPGGYHVMLMNLKQMIKTGDSVPLTLQFEGKDRKVEMIEVVAEVRDLTSKAPAANPHQH